MNTIAGYVIRKDELTQTTNGRAWARFLWVTASWCIGFPLVVGVAAGISAVSGALAERDWLTVVLFSGVGLLFGVVFFLVRLIVEARRLRFAIDRGIHALEQARR